MCNAVGKIREHPSLCEAHWVLPPCSHQGGLTAEVRHRPSTRKPTKYPKIYPLFPNTVVLCTSPLQLCFANSLGHSSIYFHALFSMLSYKREELEACFLSNGNSDSQSRTSVSGTEAVRRWKKKTNMQGLAELWLLCCTSSDQAVRCSALSLLQSKGIFLAMAV